VCNSFSNRIERKGTCVKRNVLICSLPQVFRRTACGSGGLVAKRLRSIARIDVGVHNDVDLQAPSPYKSFLHPKTWLGFIVSSCLSFKQIHKIFYVPHLILRIYGYFYTICYCLFIFILTCWQECRAWSTWPNVFSEPDSNKISFVYNKPWPVTVHKRKTFNPHFLIPYSHISELLRNISVFFVVAVISKVL
jgi:hypothetical protein